MENKNVEFKVVGVVSVRKGSKDGWWEMKLKKEDGSVVKMIGKKVGRFWSERDEEEGL